MRTFTRATIDEANEAWLTGEFDERWAPYRAAAAEQGVLYPPAGTRWDSWDDAMPSQRAILVREIEDRPRHLLAVIRTSRSWSVAVRRLIADLARQRDFLDVDPDETEWALAARREREKREAAESLQSILRHLPDVAAPAEVEA